MIREATIEDVTEITAMLLVDKPWETVETLKHSTINISKGQSYITMLINDADDGMVYVAVDDYKIVGVILGQIQSHWCTDDKYSTDYVLYIKQDYRHKHYGYQLLKHFIDESKRKGVKSFVTGLPETEFKTGSMAKLLLRQGLKQKAIWYEKEF